MALPKAPTVQLFKDIRRRMGWRTWLLLVTLVLNSVAEGIGLTLMFPLLARLGLQDPNVEASALGTVTDNVLSFLGVGADLMPLLVVIVVVFSVQNAVFLLQSWFAATYQHRYTASWRHDLFDAFLYAGWRFFADTRSTDLTNAIIRETGRISGAFFLAVQMAAAIVFMIVYFMLAIAAAWEVAVLLVIFGLVMFGATRPLIAKASAVGVEVSRRNEELQSSASEFLGGVKLIKATASEPLVMRHVDRVIEDNFRVDRWSSFNPNLIKSIYEIAAVGLLCGMIAMAVSFLTVSTAGLLVAIYMFVRLYSRLAMMQQSYQLFHLNAAALTNAQAMIDRALAKRETRLTEMSGTAVASGPASLRIEALTAGHGGAPVVKSVSMEFAAGASIALVGPSGAGKSTIVDCLLGLVEPMDGSISINDTDLQTLSLSEWRQAVGYVSQDTILFHDTVRENIRWGSPTASDEQIVAAARMANAHEFITEMENGYDTVVGDRGVRLSGGQRQRLGLARALLGEKALLVLDEPTSALDSQSEAVVMDAIRLLRGRITIIVIAHRLSTIRDADFIYVLEKGECVESGSWDELIAHGGNFSALWQIQSTPA